MILKSDAVVDVENDVVRQLFVERLLETTPLTHRERKVVEMRLGFHDAAENLEGIGREFAITRERVRQIFNKAIHKLQRHARVMASDERRKRHFVREPRGR